MANSEDLLGALFLSLGWPFAVLVVLVVVFVVEVVVLALLRAALVSNLSPSLVYALRILSFRSTLSLYSLRSLIREEYSRADFIILSRVLFKESCRPSIFLERRVFSFTIEF